jgi:DNA (cytosine-5)-methyltransferase 1
MVTLSSAAVHEVEATQLALFSGDMRVPPAMIQVRGDDWDYLRSAEVPEALGAELRVADLFSGCGGISLGLREAALAFGRQFRSVFAADFDPDALTTFVANFAPSITHESPIERVIDGHLGSALTIREVELKRKVGLVDVLVGGPPCQGHSDLNNFARRDDPKNALYLRMARAAEVFEPKWILIENVVGVAHDKQRVMQRTLEHLDSLGFELSSAIMDASAIGVPQRRRRLVILASRIRAPSVPEIISMFRSDIRDVRWAIEDLRHAASDDLFDRPARSNSDTRARIEHLFASDSFELPDALRPACHRDKKHTYKSIYGRLRWEQAAQTITSGFYSMCMGRYVHPAEPRTLTAHEAARLQFFPDHFDFSSITRRTSLAQIIGNAVPMKLSYAIGAAMLAANSAE